MSIAGLLVDRTFAHQVTEEAAHCGQPPLHAARTEAAGVGTRGEHAHVLAVDALPVDDVGVIEKIGERADVARVVRRAYAARDAVPSRDA